MNEKDSLVKYIINFDEFINLLGEDIAMLVGNAAREKYPQINTNNLEALLEDIKELLPSEKYRGLTHSIDLIINNSTVDGAQKIEGRFIDIPPLIKNTEEVFIFDKDIYITGLNVNQTGWKKNDSYDLIIKKRYLLENIFTKEVGEHKYLNTYFEVKANTPITFVLKNKSGNSRQTFVDLEYIEKKQPTVPPNPPPQPPDNTTDTSWLNLITHDFDIAVIMNWESNIVADIDLHGFIGDTHVWYGDQGDDTFKLDFDWTSHLDNTNPEIITVKGHKNSSLEIYVHNFKPTLLTKPVNLRIYSKDGYKLLKEYNVELSNDRTYLKGIFSIDLNTLIITNLNNTKTI